MNVLKRKKNLILILPPQRHKEKVMGLEKWFSIKENASKQQFISMFIFKEGPK
jgi:hypothetical protein